LLAWAAARNSCCCFAFFSCLVADQLAFCYAMPTHTLCFPSLCRHEFRQCAAALRARLVRGPDKGLPDCVRIFAFCGVGLRHGCDCFPSSPTPLSPLASGVGLTGSSPSSPLSTSTASPQLAAPLAGCSFWAVPGVSPGASSAAGSALTAAPFNVSDALAVVVLSLPVASSLPVIPSSPVVSSTRVLCVSGAFRARTLPRPTRPSSAPPPSRALRDQFLDFSLAEGSL
jgi:hypothetical protein